MKKIEIIQCSLKKCKWNKKNQCSKEKIEIDSAGQCTKIFIENPRYTPDEIPNYMKNREK